MKKRLASIYLKAIYTAAIAGGILLAAGAGFFWD